MTVQETARSSSALNRWINGLLAYLRPRDPRGDVRTVEMLLAAQASFLVILAVGAPFGGFGLDAVIGLGLMLQTGATLLALQTVRAGWWIVARILYVPLALLTYVEAIRNTGVAGGIFALEAVLSLVASYYIFVVPGRIAAAARADASEEEETQDGRL